MGMRREWEQIVEGDLQSRMLREAQAEAEDGVGRRTLQSLWQRTGQARTRRRVESTVGYSAIGLYHFCHA